MWSEIGSWLENNAVKIQVNVEIVLFGFHKEPYYSVNNFVILIAKKYIWTNKFKATPLSFAAFKVILRQKLLELNEMYEFIGQNEKFSQWSQIYNSVQ